METQIINAGVNMWLVIALTIWVLPWKGVALWKASKQDDKKWFIAMLVLNTLAILEILYIFYFSKKTQNNEELNKD